jgi:hypothetical protein
MVSFQQMLEQHQVDEKNLAEIAAQYPTADELEEMKR